MAKKFGIGHRYELGLTGGKQGVAPNDEWKRNNPRIREKWYDGDTISAGIGQGYVDGDAVRARRHGLAHRRRPSRPIRSLVASRRSEVPDQTMHAARRDFAKGRWTWCATACSP